jgi:hypothetical protein
MLSSPEASVAMNRVMSSFGCSNETIPALPPPSPAARSSRDGPSPGDDLEFSNSAGGGESDGREERRCGEKWPCSDTRGQRKTPFGLAASWLHKNVARGVQYVQNAVDHFAREVGKVLDKGSFLASLAMARA